MTKEKELEATLDKLITKTEHALEDGSIFSGEYREELNKAKEKLGIQNNPSTAYSTEAGCHIVTG